MDALMKVLIESGLPVTIIKGRLTPEQQKRAEQIEKDVRNYVMKIEEAHKRAAHSTLHFGGLTRGTELSSVPLFLDGLSRPPRTKSGF